MKFTDQDIHKLEAEIEAVRPGSILQLKELLPKGKGLTVKPHFYAGVWQGVKVYNDKGRKVLPSQHGYYYTIFR